MRMRVFRVCFVLFFAFVLVTPTWAQREMPKPKPKPPPKPKPSPPKRVRPKNPQPKNRPPAPLPVFAVQPFFAESSLPSTQPAQIARLEEPPLPPPVFEMEFVLIPAGSFLMGSNTGYTDEKPVHKVTISKPFRMGKYEVTQRQWRAVMGANPSYFQGDDLPVENVSWNDVQEFLRKLNQREKTDKYRLPTEAEWEYACRAGTTGNFAGDLNEMGWHDGNSGSKIHPVGAKKPNAWGLYDMHGNVWEWCADWYDSGYYKKSPSVDPAGPSTGQYRVLRGGSWDINSYFCRSAYRFRNSPDYRYDFFGFRVMIAPRTQ